MGLKTNIYFSRNTNSISFKEIWLKDYLVQGLSAEPWVLLIGNYFVCLGYCEANPNATKFGLTAFTYLPELGLTNISTAGQACADIGGRLPLLKSGLVMSGIHDYFGSITIPRKNE